MRRLLAIAFLFIVLPSAVSASYTRVSRTFVESNSETFTVTVPSTTSGNRLIVEMMWTNTTCLTSMNTPSDNKSSTYNADLPAADPRSASDCVAVWSATNIASGITTVTINGSVTGNATNVWVEEWNGTASSGGADKTADANYGGTANWTSGTTATLSGSTDLAIAFVSDVNGSTTSNTPTNGFGDGQFQNGAGGWKMAIENQTLSSTTGIAGTGTWNASTGGFAAVITYQAAGGGGGVVRHRAWVIQK
jgi:hypothetical protein